jgi:hypothetical protein
MTTLHDDNPHPVPPLAYLRWKENYFFIFKAPEQQVFGMAHFNFEPGFSRGRLSCNLSVDGEVYNYGNAIPFPADFEMAKSLGDDKLKVQFVEPHKRFEVSLNSDDIEAAFSLEGRFHTFDYSACRSAAPELPSFQEVMTLGMNLPYNHQQQSLSLKGRVIVKKNDKAIELDGYGYRDHSWCMRCDGIVNNHDWCGINLPGRAFGVKTLSTNHRPGLRAKEGYIVDEQGHRALRSIEAERIGEGPDGLPAKLVHHLKDVFGNVYTLSHDITNRYAYVPLVAEAPLSGKPYAITENFCRSTLVETGEEGVSLIELGRFI